VVVETDLGDWSVHETPGHAPNHVCLFQPEHRLLISGDHLLGRVSPYFDYGHSPDPVGEFLDSLNVVQALKARLCLAGHGRTFTDVDAHVQANRALVSQRLEKVAGAILTEPLTPFEIVRRAYDSSLPASNGPWLLTETLSMLVHLQRIGRAGKVAGDPGQVAGDPGRVAADPGRGGGGSERVAADPGQVAGDPERWLAH
jgi:hypothetical protein